MTSRSIYLRLDHVLDSPRVIFVCHSMGGIAVRKFLVERAADLIDRKTEIGLFLISSPSLGSSYGTWLRPLAQFLGHAQGDALRFAQSNAWLKDLDKEFQNLKESGRLSIKGKELVEDRFVILKRLLRKQVVEPFSGARYFGEPYKVPASDHFSIAKPDDGEAIQHRLLVKFIRNMFETSPQKRQNATSTSGESKRKPVTESDRERPVPLIEMRGSEYDRWYNELSNGFVEVTFHPGDSVEMNILTRILAKVLREKEFSQTVAGTLKLSCGSCWQMLASTSGAARRL